MTPGEIPDKTPSPTEGKSDGANPFDDDDLYNFGSSSSDTLAGKRPEPGSGQEPLNRPQPADDKLYHFLDGVVGEPEGTSDPSAVQAGEPPAEPEAGRPYSLEAWRGRLVDEGRVFTGRVAQSANALQANIDSLNAPGLTEGARNELLFRMGLRRAEMTAATAYIANRYGLLTGDIVAPEDKPQNKQVDDDLGLTKARENATDAVRKWIDYSGNTYRNPRIVETRKRIQDQCKKMIHDPVIDTSDPSNGMVELLHRYSHVNNHDIKYDDERQGAVRYLDFIELINSRNIVTIMWEFGQSLGLSKEARTAILQEPESWMVSESGWTQQDEELPEFLRPKDESQSKGSGQGPSSEPSVAASASGDIPAVTTTQEQAGASGAAVGGAGVEPEQVRTAPGAGVAHAAGQETADGAVTPDAAQTLVPEPAIPPPTPEHASSTPMIVIPLLIPGQGAEGQTEKKKTEAEDTLVIPVEVPGFASPVYVLVQMGSAPAARDLGVRLANIVAARMEQIAPSFSGGIPLTQLEGLVAEGVTCYQETMRAYRQGIFEGFIRRYPNMQPEEAQARAEERVAEKESHLQPTIIAIGQDSEAGLVNIASTGGDRAIVYQLVGNKVATVFRSSNESAGITRDAHPFDVVDGSVFRPASGSRLVVLPLSQQLPFKPLRRAMQGETSDVHFQLRELISHTRGDAASDTTAIVIDIPRGKLTRKQQLAQRLNKTRRRIGDSVSAIGDHLLSRPWWSVSAGSSTNEPVIGGLPTPPPTSVDSIQEVDLPPAAEEEPLVPPPPPPGAGEPPPPPPGAGEPPPPPSLDEGKVELAAQPTKAVQAEVSVPGDTPALSETTAETAGQPAEPAPVPTTGTEGQSSPESQSRFNRTRSIIGRTATFFRTLPGKIRNFGHFTDEEGKAISILEKLNISIKRYTEKSAELTGRPGSGIEAISLAFAMSIMVTKLGKSIKEKWGGASTKEEKWKIVGGAAKQIAIGLLCGWAKAAWNATKHTYKVIKGEKMDAAETDKQVKENRFIAGAGVLVGGGISWALQIIPVTHLITAKSFGLVSGRGLARFLLSSFFLSASTIEEKTYNTALDELQKRGKNATPEEVEKKKAEFLQKHLRAQAFIRGAAAGASWAFAIGAAASFIEQAKNLAERFEISEPETTPTEAPTTEPEAVLHETATPTEHPTEGPAATATDTPAPSSTPPPTHTMMPTASPTAHLTPTHTPTSEPTATTVPEATAIPPTEQPWPEGLQQEVDIDGDGTTDATVEDLDHDGIFDLVKDGQIWGSAVDSDGDGTIDYFASPEGLAVAYCNWDQNGDIDAVFAKEDTNPFTGETQDLYQGLDPEKYTEGDPENGVFSHEMLFNKNGEPVKFTEGAMGMHHLANQVAMRPPDEVSDTGSPVVETVPTDLQVLNGYKVDGHDLWASPTTGELYINVDTLNPVQVGFDMDGDHNVDILAMNGNFYATADYDGASDLLPALDQLIQKQGDLDAFTPPTPLAIANLDSHQYVQTDIDNDGEPETFDVSRPNDIHSVDDPAIEDKVNGILHPDRETEAAVKPENNTGIKYDETRNFWYDKETNGLFIQETSGQWTQVGFAIPGMNSENVDLIRIMNSEGEWEWHQVGDIENLRELADKVNTAISGDKIEVADLEVDGNDMVVGQLEDGSFVNLTETDGAVQPALFDDPAVANAVNAAWTAAHPGTGAAGSDDKTSEGYPKTFLGRDGKEHNIIYGAKGGAWGLLMQKIAEKHKDDASWDGNDTVHAAGHAWNELKPVVAPFAGDRPIIGQGEDLQDWLDRVMRAVPEDDKDDVLEDIQAALGKAGVTGVSLSGSSEG